MRQFANVLASERQLVVAISSRALFDLDLSHQVFEQEGIPAYREYQIGHEQEILNPGPAFHFVQKLLNVNTLAGKPLIEVVLVSRNSADTGLRIFHSIAHHGLPIVRAAFSAGQSPYRYLAAFKADLFLSLYSPDVKDALSAGFAAATLLPRLASESSAKELRIAFDGDAVLFSDEAERIYQTQDIDAFVENESMHADTPLGGGPFKGFLGALNHIQSAFPVEDCPVRTALVTARAAPAHERVVRTLRAWDIRIDEAVFLGGLSKAEFLKAFQADVFFDDQQRHCDEASEHVAVGHVPHGIVNQ